MKSEFQKKANELGLVEDKYRFLFGPEGFRITAQDRDELTRLGKNAYGFIADADQWYRRQNIGSHMVSVLQSGIPKSYLSFGFCDGLPQTLMVDTVWTEDGWRIVEIDTTNRNGLGFPMVMRHLYGLPNTWKGTDTSWREAGFSGTTQIMGRHCRFYEPYYRFFLNSIGGVLIREDDLEERIQELKTATSLVDLPLFHKGEFIEDMVRIATKVPIGIPPKHHLSSKALVALPWENVNFQTNGAGEFLPQTNLLRKTTPRPDCSFFVKTLQSGGAHGTFFTDGAKFSELQSRRPKAIVQHAWKIAKRSIAFLDGDTLKKADKFIRFSLFVAPGGEIVDADVTASDETIVHGGNRSIMTVPVLV